MLAAIAVVADVDGKTVYRHSAGKQNLEPNAPSVDPNSTVMLGSAGKFITHIAAIQCVERGLIGLDDPAAIEKHLPEVAVLKVYLPSDDEPGFILREPTKKITLRHLLTHSSGISYPGDEKLEKWTQSDKPAIDENAHIIVKIFSMPLLHEPGEGWTYGSSVEWVGLLILRLTGLRLVEFVQKNIFDALDMKMSTYYPEKHAEIWAKKLQMVNRESGVLVAEPDDTVQGLTCSVGDLQTLLVDLLGQSKLLSQPYVDEIFKPQFVRGTPTYVGAREDIRKLGKSVGVPTTLANPPVNASLAALFVEDGVAPLSNFPPGTLTWSGMPNVIWAVNREKGKAAIFATQLLPVEDDEIIAVAMSFMRGAWTEQ
ncbi:Protein kinase [Mycena indigotica]|uniref:Protein kinase n=1 Tax=Mycena indigotica TaxID=2126181 RepID=A0A8H6S2D8_9AGAR|nr:Protein kinase [Mycena indigotica]KAF7291965.1 Protein kinase [Mycena indigotica]